MKKRKKKRKTAKADIPAVAAALVMTFAVIFVTAAVTLLRDKSDIKVLDEAELQMPYLGTKFVLDGEKLNAALARQYSVHDFSALEINETLLNCTARETSSAKLVPIYNALFSSDGTQVVSLADSKLKCRSDMISPLSEMFSAFYRDTKLRTLMIDRAYEPYTEPEPRYSYDEYGNYTELPPENAPDFSDGYSIYFGLYLSDKEQHRDFTLEDDYGWFTRHAHEYGFILRYPNEKEDLTGSPFDPAYWRYVGKTAAQIFSENHLCFEEFSDFMQSYSADSPLMLNCDDEDTSNDIVVYTQHAENNSLKLPADSMGQDIPCNIFGLGEDIYMIEFNPTDDLYIEVEK